MVDDVKHLGFRQTRRIEGAEWGGPRARDGLVNLNDEMWDAAKLDFARLGQLRLADQILVRTLARPPFDLLPPATLVLDPHLKKISDHRCFHLAVCFIN